MPPSDCVLQCSTTEPHRLCGVQKQHLVWSYSCTVVHSNFFGLMGYYYFVLLWGYALQAPLIEKKRWRITNLQYTPWQLKQSLLQPISRLLQRLQHKLAAKPQYLTLKFVSPLPFLSVPHLSCAFDDCQKKLINNEDHSFGHIGNY